MYLMRNNTRPIFLWVSIFLILLVFAPAFAQEYTITDLGAYSTTYPTSHAVGISPSGQYVTGDANDNNYNRHLFRWTQSGGLNLPATSLSNWGYSVNNLGYTVGQTTVGSYLYPCYYNGTTVTYFGGKGCAYGINAQNSICGQSYWSSTAESLAFWYNQASGIFSIGKLATGNNYIDTSCAFAMNEYGKIVGSSAYVSDGKNKQHAFLWTPASSNAHTGSMVDIHTTADYSESYAKAINDNDEVTGFCWNSYGENNKRAFYKPASGQMQILPNLSGPYQASEAVGINDSGIIVGSVGYLNDRGSGACFAARWVGGQMQLLNDCIDLRSTWNLDEAAAINDNGQIVGTGTINKQRHGFLLTPIANPTTSPTPHIDSVSPTSVHYGGVIHIYGSGFTTGSVVISAQTGWVYPKRLATTYVSSTQLDASIPGATITSVWVQNPRPGGGESNHINVTTVANRYPILADDTATTLPNTALDIDVLANDTDPDQDQITIVSAGWQSGTPGTDGKTKLGGIVSVVAADGKTMIHYVPPVLALGMDQFVYRVADSANYTSMATVTVNIDDGSLPPVAGPDSGTCLKDNGFQIDVLANDTGTDAYDHLTITSGNAATANGGIAYVSTWNDYQTFWYTAPPGFTGTDTFTYTLTNSHGKTSTTTVTVQVLEHWLPMAVNDTAQTCLVTPINIDVLANDSDPNPDTTFSISGVDTPPNGTASILTVEGKQFVQYQPVPGFSGTDTFTYTITDSYGGTASATVTINVLNDNVPVATPDSAMCLMNQSVDIDVLANDSDPDPGDTIAIISENTTTSAGGYAGLAWNGEKQWFVYSAPEGFTGTDSFHYTVADSNGGIAQGTVTIQVVEHLPPVAADDNVQTFKDTSVNIDVLVNDSDPDGNAALSIYNIDTPSNGGTVSIVEVGGNQFVQYQPALGFSGTDTFIYAIVDTYGGTATATVTVNVVDDNPPIAVKDAAICPINQWLDIDVMTNDSDQDPGDTISITSGSITTSAGGTALLVSSVDRQWYSYCPPQDFSGTDTFEYTITDRHGATSTAMVAIQIYEHCPPIAVDDTALTLQDTSAIIDVVANDFNPEHTGTISIMDVGAPSSGGTVSIIQVSGKQYIKYQPAPGFTGTDTFSYTIANGYSLTAVGNVTVTDGDVSNRLIAVPDSAMCLQNDYADIYVQANDTYSAPVVNITSGSTQTTQGGMAWLVYSGDGVQSFYYSAPQGFVGTDTFVYTITNDLGETSTALVTVEVMEHLPPVAVDDIVSTSVGSGLWLYVQGNDSDHNRWPNNNTRLTAVGTPTNGNVDWDPTGNGWFYYQPNQGFVGADTFTYTIVNDFGLTASAKVTVIVNNNPPVATADSTLILLNQSVSIDVLSNDVDPDGDVITITSGDVTTTSGGTASLQTDRETGRQRILYNPAPDFFGTDAFQYTIADSHGATSTTTVTVNVGAELQIAECLISPDRVAAGDTMRVRAFVNDDPWQVLGVAVDGVEMQQIIPGQWEADIVASKALGSHQMTLTATDAIGQTKTASVSYEVCPVYAANTRAMLDAIMAKASSRALFVICGKVTTTGDSSFWLDDGGKQIKVMCSYGSHGFFDGDFVRVRGQYSYSSDPDQCCLKVMAADHINKQ